MHGGRPDGPISCSVHADAARGELPRGFATGQATPTMVTREPGIGDCRRSARRGAAPGSRARPGRPRVGSPVREQRDRLLEMSAAGSPPRGSDALMVPSLT